MSYQLRFGADYGRNTAWFVSQKYFTVPENCLDFFFPELFSFSSQSPQVQTSSALKLSPCGLDQMQLFPEIFNLAVLTLASRSKRKRVKTQ